MFSFKDAHHYRRESIISSGSDSDSDLFEKSNRGNSKVIISPNGKDGKSIHDDKSDFSKLEGINDAGNDSMGDVNEIENNEENHNY